MDPKVFRHDEIPCPVCKRKLDAATSVSGGGAPDDGAISFCMYCGTMLVYARLPFVRSSSARLILRRVTDREFKELPADERSQLMRIKAKLRSCIASRN